MRQFFYRLLLTLAFIAAPATSEYEVPTKKAMPPKMDPIPTLPVVTHRAYIDVQIDGQDLGRIVFGLFGSVAPKAVENFVALCSCNRGKGKLTGKELCYKGTKIHRVITNFIIQGGDIEGKDGTGGESIFGGYFEDESFEVKHNRRYMLNMANSGKKNTNGSQWYINTVKTQWLDGKDMIFGMVLSGKEVIEEIEHVGTYGGKPRSEIVIVDSGSLPTTPEDAQPRIISEQLKE
mmetsp:Transcript_82151/g.238203  ORF Transcript_82151/g.238203 Transcript_82151/m.238203 type:complete len:234 (+) Transcript_82151:86-787(+)